jgi:hypothetical protein
LQALTMAKGFGRFSYAFPVGLDVGIVVLLALDLLLIRRRTPWPVLRLIAHLFTAATIAFNANAGGASITGDPLGAALHGVIPVMFVASVEAGRRLVLRVTALEDGRERPGVPLHRWLLAPGRTFALWRRMKLWDVDTYAEAVAREQALTVYRVLLEREYGSVRKAPSDVRLPLTLAPYGLTIEQALAQPQQQRERELALQAAQEAAELAQQTRAAELAAQAEIARLRTAGAVEAARHEVSATAGTAEVRARAELAAAERAAVAETSAIESAETAEADARRAAAELAAAEARQRAAGIAERAAETERAAAEANRQAAEAAAATEAENARAAREKKAAAEAAAEAAEIAERAAEARRRTAEIERAAVEAEDIAHLTPKERAVRRVARLVLTEAGGDAERLPLETVAAELGLSVSTASERRREAAELLASGYRPQAA